MVWMADLIYDASVSPDSILHQLQAVADLEKGVSQEDLDYNR